MDDDPGRNLRPVPVRAELELRDHAEIAAAAPQRPEQVRRAPHCSLGDLAVGGDDLGSETRLSAAKPSLREVQPKPAPSVKPATPVAEMMPLGTTRPCGCVAASTSFQVAPGSTRTTPRS